MESDQVDFLARAMFGDFEEIDQAQESGLSGKLRGDFLNTDLLNGIDFDVAFFHAVSVAGFDVRKLPDADAAGDFAGADSFA
jgi:hypothetical protein